MLLATQIGRELGMRDATFELLAYPRGGRSTGRMLVMKPRFAAALEKAGWLH
jgi:hypothetical protein